MISSGAAPRRCQTLMPPLLICERKCRWAADWRRLARICRESWPQLGLVEVRTGADCLAALAREPAAFVLLECTKESLYERLLLLAQIDRQHPQALCAAAADKGIETWHALLREFGAVHVICSPLGLVELAEMIGRCASSGGPQEESVREQVWRRLPWPEAASREGVTSGWY